VESQGRTACGDWRFATITERSVVDQLALASPGSASNHCEVVTFPVNSCPFVNSIDASKPDGNGTVSPFDLRPTESTETRLADSYSPLSPTRALSIREDSKKLEVLEKEQHNKTNCVRHICIEEHETQERLHDKHRTFERDALHKEPGETRHDGHLHEQSDSRNLHGGYQSTASSQKSAPSDSEVCSGRSEYSFSDTGSCDNDKAKYLGMSTVDEQPNYDDFHLCDASILDTTSESMHWDCISGPSFSGNDSDAGLEDLDYLADEHEQRDSHKDSYQELHTCGHQKTPSRAEVLPKSAGSADCLSSAEPADYEWELIKITSKKHSNGTNYYKVRWKETWEPEDTLGNARKLVDAYEKRRRARLARQSERARKRQARGEGKTR